MTIPSGGGSEILNSNYVQGISAETLILQGYANHIYTIVSIIICNTDGSSREVYLKRYDGTGTSNEHLILMGETIPSESTFIMNDRFVIVGSYNLRLTSASGNADCVISYIEQDWT